MGSPRASQRPIRRIGAFVAVLSFYSTAVAEESIEEEPASLHVDFDAGAGLSVARFVAASDLLPTGCTGGGPCVPADVSVPVMRASLAVGWEAYAVEATLELPLEGESTLGTVASFGARVDTSHDAWLSLHFRMSYVRRIGDFDGQGGRFGVGIVLRPFDFAAIYGEATGDVTTVPAEMNEAGTLFSYGYYVGGGIRLSVGML